jgi:hypothetical protein
MIRTALLAFAVVSSFGTVAQSRPFVLPDDPEAARFVASTFISTFYHEYGHALVDVLDIPVLGREEDAVDSLSNILLHYLHEGDDALDIIWDNALSWALLQAMEDEEGWEWNFSGPHSLTPQRFEQFLCEMVGGDPEARDELAKWAEYDQPRVAQCVRQFEQIDYDWGRMLEGWEPGPRSKGLRLADTDPDTDLALILGDELEILNAAIGLPVWVDVSVEECGEFNAFYSPDMTRIIMCQEWAEGMLALFRAQDRLLD